MRQGVVGHLESDSEPLTPLSRERGGRRIEEVATREHPLAWSQDTMVTRAHPPPECQRLMTIEGIGPVTARALGAAVREASAFTHGRPRSAWWGWVPRPHATGGKAPRLGLRKRGDKSWRKLLVDGAWAVVASSRGPPDRRSQGSQSRAARRGVTRSPGAVANPNAHVIGALLRTPPADQGVTSSGPCGEVAALAP